MAAAGVGGYLAVREGSASPSAASAALQTPAAAPSAGDVKFTEVEAKATPPKAPEASRPTSTASRRPSAPSSAPSTPALRDQAPAAAPAQAPPAPVEETPRASTPVDEIALPAQEPPRIDFDDLTVAADAVIGIRIESAISTATAKVEDRVTARVTRDVSVDGRTAIPAGSTLEGTVTTVQRGGKFKERARLGVRFHSLVLADNVRVPIQTETIVRQGDAPGGEATAKIGGAAVVGAILGGVIGGKKGAAIGTTAGAAGGTAAVMAGGANEAVLPAGTSLTVRLTGPATVRVKHE